MSKVRVLALTRYARMGASSRLRTLQYVEPLAQEGVAMHVAPLFGDDYVEALYGRGQRAMLAAKALARRAGLLRRARGYDAIWVEKEALPWLPAALERALLPGRTPLILDYDDAVFHRYDRHRLGAVRAVLGRKLDRLMAASSLVVAGNDYLAERARDAGARRVEIVPTVVDLDRYVLKARAAGQTPTVGWIGSPATAPYLDVLKPVLGQLATETPVRAVAIGARPDQLAGSVFEALTWTEEGEVDALRSLDIGVMPLEDTPWERGKCGYKLIQYMAAGLPVVASPVGVNTRIVRPGVNGFLAATEVEWRTALATLAADPALRATMGAAGRRIVEEEYSLQIQAPRLAGLIREAARR